MATKEHAGIRKLAAECNRQSRLCRGNTDGAVKRIEAELNRALGPLLELASCVCEVHGEKHPTSCVHKLAAALEKFNWGERETRVTDNPIALAGNSCKYVEHTPVFSKHIGGIAICPSEFVNEKGAHIMDQDAPCHLVADHGETYCPRHKLIVAMRKKGRGRRDE